MGLKVAISADHVSYQAARLDMRYRDSFLTVVIMMDKDETSLDSLLSTPECGITEPDALSCYANIITLIHTIERGHLFSDLLTMTSSSYSDISHELALRVLRDFSWFVKFSRSFILHSLCIEILGYSQTLVMFKITPNLNF